MASTSAPASACRVTPARSTASFLPARSLAGCRAVVWRCWCTRRGRRRGWAGLRARCVGGQSSAVQPDSENAGEGLMEEEDGPRRPPFDLNLAVVLAGFAFEAYTSPPVSPLFPSWPTRPRPRTALALQAYGDKRHGLAYMAQFNWSSYLAGRCGLARDRCGGMSDSVPIRVSCGFTLPYRA
jgi:hypothetical protein